MKLISSRKIISVTLAVAILLLFSIPVLAQTKYESYEVDDDGQKNIFAAEQHGNTFTPQVSHTVTSVWVKAYRTGSPGTLTILIYNTAASLPTGAPIGQGSIDADTFTAVSPGEWYEITLDTGVPVVALTEYAFAGDSETGAGGDIVSIRMNAGDGAYANGQRVFSNNNGVDWGAIAADDVLFQEWEELPAPPDIGVSFLRSVLRVAIAAVILVGAIRLGGQGVSLVITSTVGVIAFVIIDTLLSILS